MHLKSSGILLFNNSSVLLQLRDNIPEIAFPNTWSFPGGGFELHENSKQCIIREIKEECNYDLSVSKLYKMLSAKKFFNDKICTIFVYITEYNNRQKIECLEGQKMEFVELHSIKNINNMPGLTKNIIFEGYKIYKALKSQKYFDN